MKTTYTPGPWNVVGVTMSDVTDQNGKFIYEGIGTVHPYEEVKANARLIAAAPELLDYLNAIKAVINQDIKPEGKLRAIEICVNQAIQKATQP